MSDQKTVFIVGAGFSKNAGLPIQSEFTELMLAAVNHKTGMRRRLMPDLEKFVKQVFDYSPGQPIDQFPELEDIFTTIDLSANTGHHLGPRFPPQLLRRIRRILISNIIRMLNAAYLDERKKPQDQREVFLNLLRSVTDDSHQFVSLNWDVVLESCLTELNMDFAPFYSHEIKPAKIDGSRILEHPQAERKMLIAKMHGSINWLYCDCCHRTFAVPSDKVASLAYQVLKQEEMAELFPKTSHQRLKCPRCDDVDMSVRLATFSYQKAMRTPMFESSWLEAEKALRRSKKWVFIGYSLPAADFEFKYLLKRIQLARTNRLKIQVVTKVDRTKHPEPNNDPTVIRYKRLFGDRNVTFFFDGLQQDIISTIL